MKEEKQYTKSFLLNEKDRTRKDFSESLKYFALFYGESPSFRLAFKKICNQYNKGELPPGDRHENC